MTDPDYIPDVKNVEIAKLTRQNEGLIQLLSNICRVVETIFPELLKWAGLDEWWAKNRSEDAIQEGLRQLTSHSGSFEAKCEVLRKLTQEERETIGYGRFPLRLEDYEL